jgi:hypothetical protein
METTNEPMVEPARKDFVVLTSDFSGADYTQQNDETTRFALYMSSLEGRVAQLEAMLDVKLPVYNRPSFLNRRAYQLVG